MKIVKKKARNGWRAEITSENPHETWLGNIEVTIGKAKESAKEGFASEMENRIRQSQASLREIKKLR